MQTLVLRIGSMPGVALVHRLATVLSCGLFTVTALALDVDPSLLVYGQAAWRVQKNELTGVPISLTQNKDGDLRIGGNAGLLRLDDRKFTPPLDAVGRPRLNETVLTPPPTTEGGVWMGTAHGARQWRAGEVRHFESDCRFNASTEDANGDAWYPGRPIFEGNQPLARVSGDQARLHDEGASIGFSIPPTFVQCCWLGANCAAAALLVIWSGYWFRIRQVRMLLQAEAGERKRIATELHDTVLQAAQGLVILLDGRFKGLRLDACDRVALDQAVERANDLVREGRDRIHNLRISDSSTVELFQALEGAGEALAAFGTAEFHATWTGANHPVAGAVKEELRRLAAEALSNAFHHAHARTITLAMAVGPRELRLCVRDDGIGIPSAAMQHGCETRHWGITGMRERAERIGARLAIVRQESGGTEVRVTLSSARAFGLRNLGALWPSVNCDRKAVADREAAPR